MAEEEWREVTKSKSSLLNSEVSEEFSFSLSVPSQPPDIRNWFSSYESQELLVPIKDLNGFDEFEEDETETQDPFEDCRKRKHQEPNETNSFSSEKLELPSEVCNEILSEDNSEIKFRPLAKIKNGEKNLSENYPLNNNDDNTGTKSVVKKKQSLKKLLGEEFLLTCQKISNDESNLSKTVGPKENDCYTETIQEELRIKTQDFNSIKSEENCYTDSFQGELQNKLDDFNSIKFEGKHKEVSKENSVANGFVTIKSKPNISKENENSIKNSDTKGGFNNPLKEKTNSERKNGEKEGIRRPLMDKSNNYLVENEIKTEEFKGKWKCPQKTKPYVGPPLKQLRIEQWLNRAT